MEEENLEDEIITIDEGEEEGDSWLLAYADMMTLLTCFFILLTAFANFDPAGFQEKGEVVAQHFSKEKFEKSRTEIDQLAQQLSNKTEFENMTSTQINDDVLEISFRGNVLFDSANADLRKDVIPLVDSMIEIIGHKNPNYKIVVEGHTDSRPLGVKSRWGSNWTLSGARAAAIIARFEYNGFPPKNLKVLGLGSTVPLVPNKDSESGAYIEENLKMNRRVIIKVISPLIKGKVKKLGLGVYFETDP